MEPSRLIVYIKPSVKNCVKCSRYFFRSRGPWDLLNRVRLLKLRENWQVEILSDLAEVTSASGLKLAAPNGLLLYPLSVW